MSEKYAVRITDQYGIIRGWDSGVWSVYDRETGNVLQTFPRRAAARQHRAELRKRRNQAVATASAPEPTAIPKGWDRVGTRDHWIAGNYQIIQQGKWFDIWLDTECEQIGSRETLQEAFDQVSQFWND